LYRLHQGHYKFRVADAIIILVILWRDNTIETIIPFFDYCLNLLRNKTSLSDGGLSTRSQLCCYTVWNVMEPRQSGMIHGVTYRPQLINEIQAGNVFLDISFESTIG